MYHSEVNVHELFHWRNPFSCHRPVCQMSFLFFGKPISSDNMKVSFELGVDTVDPRGMCLLFIKSLNLVGFFLLLISVHVPQMNSNQRPRQLYGQVP